jgi:2-succinyl-6-hydroxy-2,4-cyclohexadiene-1-carboxylate synthase
MEIYGLHGFLGQPRNLLWLAEAYKKERPQARFSSPSLWEGLLEDEEMSLEGWARRFNDSVRAESVAASRYLVGYSMGGRLALHAYLDAPALWSGALILSAHYGLIEEEARKARQIHDARWAARFRSEDWGALLEAWDAQAIFGTDSAARRKKPEEGDIPREALARALERWSLGRQAYLLPRLKGHQHKLRWLVGSEDRKFAGLCEDAAFTSLGIPSYVIAGAHHRLLEDAPDAVLWHLLDATERIDLSKKREER